MDSCAGGVGGRPAREKLLEVATSPADGAPNKSEGGLEAVCPVTRAGEGENGRDERGIVDPEADFGGGEVGGVMAIMLDNNGLALADVASYTEEQRLTGGMA